MCKIVVKALRTDGTVATPYELGRIAVSLPLPPGTMSTLFKNNELFNKTFFQRYPVCLFISNKILKYI